MSGLRIYGIARTRAFRALWMASELGLDYEHIPIETGLAGARKPDYLAINPNGRLPAIDDDGFILWESLAVNLYLAKKHSTGRLYPATLDGEARTWQWCLWAANEVEPHSLTVLNHRVAKPPAERDPKLAQAAVEALRVPFDVLDRHLAGSGHVVGSRFTVADINTAEVVRYAMPAPELFEAAPRVKAWLAACHARPAFKAMWAKREAEPA